MLMAWVDEEFVTLSKDGARLSLLSDLMFVPKDWLTSKRQTLTDGQFVEPSDIPCNLLASKSQKALSLFVVEVPADENIAIALCREMNGIANPEVTSASCECLELAPERIHNDCVTQRLAISNMTSHLELQEPDVRTSSICKSVETDHAHMAWTLSQERVHDFQFGVHLFSRFVKLSFDRS